MACYPIILLIAGLQKHDDTVALSGTINHLVKSCKNACNGKSDSNFPMSYRLPNFSNYNKKFDDIKYDNDDINYGIKYDDDDINYGDITPTPLNEDKYKELMKLFVPEYQVTENSKKIETELIKNSYYEDFDDKKTLLRESQKGDSIAIPTVEDAKTLVKVLKNRVPMIAVSKNLIKQLTNMKHGEIITDPFFSNLSGMFGKNKSFLGVPTVHLVYLIIDTFKNLQNSGSKLHKPFLKQFGNVFKAALDFIGVPKKPVAEEKRGFLQKFFG